MRLLTLASVLAVGLAACSGGSGEAATTTVTTAPTSTTTSTFPGDDGVDTPVMGIAELEIRIFLADDFSFGGVVGRARFIAEMGDRTGVVEVDMGTLTDARATAACEELSTFLASHPDATGVGTVVINEVIDDGVGALVDNTTIRPGDAGRCVAS